MESKFKTMINGIPVSEYVEKEEKKEISTSLSDEISEVTWLAKTGKVNYFSVHRAKKDALYDKSQKHGKTKFYTRKEVAMQNILLSLKGEEKAIYSVVIDANRPIGITDIMISYTSANAGNLSMNSRQSFTNYLNRLMEKGYIKRIAMKKNKPIAYKPGFNAYYLPVNPQDKTSGEQKEIETNQAGEKQPEQENQTQNQNPPELYDYLNFWMDKNDIAELQIIIKKRN